MTKAEFDAKYDECYSSLVRSIVNENLVTKRLIELNDGENRVSSEEFFASALICSLELSSALLRSVLTEVLELGD